MADAFAAYFTDNMLIFPQDLEEAYICDTLGLTEKELHETSYLHIEKRLINRGARNKAENEKVKQQSKKG